MQVGVVYELLTLDAHARENYGSYFVILLFYDSAVQYGNLKITAFKQILS